MDFMLLRSLLDSDEASYSRSFGTTWTPNLHRLLFGTERQRRQRGWSQLLASLGTPSAITMTIKDGQWDVRADFPEAEFGATTPPTSPATSESSAPAPDSHD